MVGSASASAAGVPDLHAAIDPPCCSSPATLSPALPAQGKRATSVATKSDVGCADPEFGSLPRAASPAGDAAELGCIPPCFAFLPAHSARSTCSLSDG